MDSGKIVQIVLWVLLWVLGAYILVKGLSLDKKTLIRMGREAQEKAIETYLSAVLSAEDLASERAPLEWLKEKTESGLSVTGSILTADAGNREQDNQEGDRETDRKIIEENSNFLEEKLLEENQEAGPAGSGEENTGGIDDQSDSTDGSEEAVTQEEKQEDDSDSQNAREESGDSQTTSAAPAVTIPLEKFQDFDFVIDNFYTVDKTTSIDNEQLNAPALLAMDLRMTTSSDQPQILIYHTHSQEDFIDSVPGDPGTTIVGVGEYLVSLLQNVYGYQVMHVTDTFDIIDGELDRSKAYNYAQEKITQVLEENPSIEVVIDLHRDGVADDRRLVTEVNGKQTAKIMFFNGLSRTNQNGEISYLPNPYIQDNLAFSLQLALQAKEYYPDWLRTIYLRGYRYNLHLRPKALLVECGAQTNTVEEEMNAMEPLADILNKVLARE